MSSSDAVWDAIYAKRAVTIMIGVLLGLLVTYGTGFPQPFMALIPIVILPLLFPNDLVEFSGQRFGGALVASMAGFFIVNFTDKPFIGITLNFFFLCLIALYVISKIVHYGSMMALITFSVLFYFSFIQPQNVVFFGLAWVFGILFGVTILRIVHYFFWPQELREYVLKSIHSYKEATYKFLSTAQTKAPFTLTEILSTLSMINAYAGSKRIDKHCLTILKAIRLKLAHLSESLNKIPQSYRDEILPIKKEFMENLKKSFEGSSKGFKKDKLEAYEAKFAMHREANHQLENNHFVALITILNQFRLLYECLEKPHKIPQIDKEAKKANVSLFTTSKCLKALRIATPITLAIIGAVYFNIPGGLQAVITSVVVILQPNDGRAAKQAYQRFLGVLLGLGCGIIFYFLMVSFESYVLFLLLFSGSIYLFSLLCMKIPKYGYVFIQACLAFLLLFTFSDIHEFDADLVVERLVGVCSGFVMTSFIVYIWPMSDPWMQMKLNLSNLYFLLGKKLHSFSKGEKGEFVSFISNHQQIHEVKEDLKFFPSKRSYRYHDMEMLYMHIDELITGAKNICDFDVSKEACMVLKEELQFISSLFLSISKTIETKGDVDMVSEVHKACVRLHEKSEQLQGDESLHQKTIKELEEIFGLISMLQSVLEISSHVKLCEVYTEERREDGNPAYI